MMDAVTNHFNQIYQSDNRVLSEQCFSHIQHLVSDDMNRALMNYLTDSEVKSAAFSMGAMKAPGPDGMNH